MADLVLTPKLRAEMRRAAEEARDFVPLKPGESRTIMATMSPVPEGARGVYLPTENVVALLDENDMLRRTAAFVHLWLTRDRLTDAERVSVIKNRPGWDRMIEGASASDELTEQRERADAAEREREAFRDMKPGRASQRRQIMRLRHGDNAKAVEALCKAANDQRDRANAAEAALAAARDALGFRTASGDVRENDAALNLEGALVDLDRLGADAVCRGTIQRVCGQLGEADRVLRAVGPATGGANG